VFEGSNSGYPIGSTGDIFAHHSIAPSLASIASDLPASTLQHILQENYIIAKIRGEKSYLLGPRQFYALTDLRTQNEILGALSDGPYGKELSKLTEESSPSKRRERFDSDSPGL